MLSQLFERKITSAGTWKWGKTERGTNRTKGDLRDFQSVVSCLNLDIQSIRQEQERETVEERGSPGEEV